jgi:very-short-patch-repair endonuclease
MGRTFRNQTLIGYARHNRRTLNDAETRLWSELGRRGFGVRFRRQHPIGPYIVDFACIALKLAVELDGSQHFESAGDAVRDAYLAERGWTVLRFWSWEALSDPDMVVRTISAVVEELLEKQAAHN